MNDSIAKLSDAAVVTRLRTTHFESKRLLAELIVLLIEVEERRIYLAKATPSLFEFCMRELRMSEGEAYRRINAVKLVRRFPTLLDHIAQGNIHLSALLQLRDHFTEANVDELVAAAKGRNKMQVAELVARLAPRPDVPAKLRKLPQHDKASRMTKASKPMLDPLSEARYRLQVTGSRQFRDKLLHARDLMMHTNPSGDLAVVVERALDELIEVLEKRIYGKLSKKPAAAERHASSKSDGVVPAPAPRAIKGGGAIRGPGLARASLATRFEEKRTKHPGARGASPSDEAVHLRQRKVGRRTVK